MTPKQATEFVNVLRNVISSKIDKRVRDPLKNAVTVNNTPTGFVIVIDDPSWKPSFVKKVEESHRERNDRSRTFDDTAIEELVNEAKRKYREANFKTAFIR